jgi:ABC-2 type transport system permease protein
VFVHSLRHARTTIVALGLGAAAFFHIVLLASSSFAGQSAETPFLTEPPRAVQALLGGTVDFLHPAGWVSAGMSHPLTLALFTAAALVVAAGAVAAEVERGSIDLVLTHPVSRRSFLAAKAAAALVAVTFVEAMGLGSALVARWTISNVAEVRPVELARVFLGSWILFCSFAMVALFVSANSRLRARSAEVSAGLVVAGFFVNFTALLVDQVYALRYASPFHYFRPTEVLAGHSLASLALPLALALAAAAAALVAFSRRDITR